MDVPFSSSGAMSRAHYALVRKVETATPQVADQILLAEVHSIRTQLARSTLTLKQCKECLVLLLYCSMAVNPGVHVEMEFALPHAINLAEAGQRIQDKRTGYLFCAEVMPPEHELQLMLVNSIRKDIESPVVSRICLALDTLIQSPSRDVVPAIQTRLHDLLSHDSPDVKRRALLAFNKLSEYDPEILRDIATKARKRLGDSDPAVVSAAFALADTLLKFNRLPEDKYHSVVSGLLDIIWSHPPAPSEARLLMRSIEVVTKLVPSRHDLKVIINVVRHYAHRGNAAYPVLQQCFRAVAVSSTDVLIEVQTSSGFSFIREIQHLLTIQEPNALYMFVCCLSSVDPKLWAGTTPGISSVLEGWEVERVMRALDCEDKLIRKQTLRTLWRVDQNIVESYFARARQGDLPHPSTYGTEDNLSRLLEILDIICGDDGEGYAHQLRNVLRAAESEGPLNKRVVLQEPVEEMLTRIHTADSAWRSGCIGVLFSSVADKDCEVGPTLMVVLTALLCEYMELSPVSPVELLQGLADRVTCYSVSVQDACLITMLRVSAASDEIPSEVVEIVNDLRARSSRHLKRRCDQFMRLSQSRDELRSIIATTRSSSLPDFVFALEKFGANQQRAPSRSPSLIPTSPLLKPYTPEPSSSRASPVPSKLRYAAYEAPRPTPKLRRRSSTNSSRQSDDAGSQIGSPFQDPMSMTVTPGDLSIAAQTADLRSIPSRSPKHGRLSPLPVVPILDEEPPPVGTGSGVADLIALDSPFMSEPAGSSLASTVSSVTEQQEFEPTWKSLESGAARGWCEASIDTILRRLQGLQRRLRVTERDRPPFEGDLKIVITPEPADPSSKKGLAAIRLKESDDNSCLWWLRCEDEELRNIVKTTLR